MTLVVISETKEFITDMKRLSNIKESVWSDIQKRSMGEQVRKEDSTNKFNRDEMYDYIYSHYEEIDTSAIPLKGTTTTDQEFFSIPLFMQSMAVYRLSASYRTGKLYRIHLYASDLDCKDFYDEMNQEFTLLKNPDHSLIITPKDVLQDVSNDFLLKVIDFICSHAKHPTLKKKEN